jgi:hypothetical protein
MAAVGSTSVREQWQRRIRADAEVGGVLLAVALAIATEARVDGTRALMSNRQLAGECVVSLATVKRHTARLRELGYLQVSEQGRRRGDGTVSANVYELTLPQRLTQMSPREFSTAQNGASAAHSGAQNGASTAHSREPPQGAKPPTRVRAREGRRRRRARPLAQSARSPKRHAERPTAKDPTRTSTAQKSPRPKPTASSSLDPVSAPTVVSRSHSAAASAAASLDITRRR